MATRNRSCGTLAILISLIGLAASASANTPWQAGVARIDITPEQPIWMSGYAHRNHPAEGTLTRLSAKAAVLDDPHGNRGAIITLDLVGIDRQLSRSICGLLKDKYGLQRHQIAICCSHTHTGPALRHNLAPIHYLLVSPRQQKLIDDYTKSLPTKIAEVVGQAITNVSPSQVTWGTGQATFAVNRRENVEPDVPQLRTDGKLQGPVDHSVPVLAIRGTDEKLRGVIFGYACHATVLSFYQWSGDYPGFAQLEIERTNPGCIALFWAGCGADQNPLPRRSVELAQHYGRRLAAAVEAVLLTSKMKEVSGSLRTQYREIDLPFSELPSRDQIQANAKSPNRYEVARAQLFLRRMDAGQPLQPAYPYPVATWNIGDQLRWVLLGGETVVDYAIGITSTASRPTWVAGYANDVMAYIPSRRVLLEGGYEGGGAMVYYGLPSPWAESVESTILDEVAEQNVRLD